MLLTLMKHIGMMIYQFGVRKNDSSKNVPWKIVHQEKSPPEIYPPEKCPLGKLPPGKLPLIPQRKKRKKRKLTPEKITS